MKTALFTNFTDQEFIGWWNGKSRKYKPGQSEYMPDYLAKHFAKHLTNQELLRTDKNGNLIHKDGDKFTSPKKPEDASLYMKLYKKAYKADELDELGEEQDDIDALIGAANKNREEQAREAKEALDKSKNKKDKGDNADGSDPTKPQVITPPDFDNEDE